MKLQTTKQFVLTAAMLLFILVQTATSQVRDGNFESGLRLWKTWVIDETNTEAELPVASATISSVEPGLGDTRGALLATIVQPGKYDWYVGAYNRVSLKTDGTYEIWFRAKATQKRNITVALFNDVVEGQAFFSDTVLIDTVDKKYGPLTFYYGHKPVAPGIKFYFGAEEGDVTLDQIALINVPTPISSKNSLEDVIGDITLPHEGWPHGATHFDWGKAPREGAKNPPDHWTAAIAWGQLYEWFNGNPATNTRVQIRDLAMYYLSKSDGEWHELQKALRVDGAAYREDFADDYSKPADIRNEPDGSISVTAGDGFNFHYWPSTGRVQYPKGDVKGCFITVNARLILDDPNGPDDRDEARYLMGVGGDWWESMDAVWDYWTTNWDMGIGRFRYVTKEWQGHNMITLSPEETRENPPPLPNATSSRQNWYFAENGSVRLTNFPNPFSDNTTIQFRLKKGSKVKLEVFNLEGKRISTLINNYRPAGNHLVEFDASGLENGIYLYKITTAGFSETRKMIHEKL